MPGGLAERAVIAALHQGDPPGWVVANRGDLLLSPGRGGTPRCHAMMMASFVCCVWHPGTQLGRVVAEGRLLVTVAVQGISQS